MGLNGNDARTQRLQTLSTEGRVAPVEGNQEHNLVNGLIDLFDLIGSQKTTLSIGCWWGTADEVIVLHSRLHWAVDPWPSDDVYAAYKRRMEPYPYVRTLREQSPEALAAFPRASIDFAYIDGDHRYAAVVADILACQRIVKIGGWIAGHDYGSLCVEVAPAVRAILGEPTHVMRDSSWAVQNR